MFYYNNTKKTPSTKSSLHNILDSNIRRYIKSDRELEATTLMDLKQHMDSFNEMPKQGKLRYLKDIKKYTKGDNTTNRNRLDRITDYFSNK